MKSRRKRKNKKVFFFETWRNYFYFIFASISLVIFRLDDFFFVFFVVSHFRLLQLLLRLLLFFCLFISSVNDISLSSSQRCVCGKMRNALNKSHKNQISELIESILQKCFLYQKQNDWMNKWWWREENVGRRRNGK